MTDSARLMKAIDDSGLKKSAIADQLNLTPYGFMRKVNGKSDFKVPEMEMLSKILGLKSTERQHIFFAEKVDY